MKRVCCKIIVAADLCLHRAKVKELEIALEGPGPLEIQAKLTTGD